MISSRIGGLAVQLWVAAFVALLGTYVVTSVVGLRVPVQLLYVLPLVAWALIALRRPGDTLDWAVLVAIAAHLVSAGLGVDPFGSFQAGGLALCFALLFWLMRGMPPAFQSTVAVAVAVPATFWVVAVAVAWIGEKMTWVAAGGGWPALESYQVFVWASVNAYPVLALLTAPFVAFIPPGRVRAILAWLLGAASVIVVPLSVGRAGWLGILSAILALEVLRGAPMVRRLLGRRSRSRMPGAAVLGGLVLVGLTLNAERIRAALAANLDSRWRIWEQAGGVFGADPVTGSGPGTFSWMRLTHVPDYADPVGVVLAHNAWLQTLADGGLVLGAAAGAVVVVWIALVWRRRASMSGAQRLAAAAVIGLGAASLLDDFSYLPAMIAMAVTLAAWSVPVASAPAQSGLHSRWLALGALILGLVVIVPAVQVERARLVATDARIAALEGRWTDAADGFSAAVDLHGTNPLNRLGLGLALADAGDGEGAHDAYGAARALSLGDPRALGSLAALTEMAGERAALLDEASRRSTDAQYAVRLSEVLLELGHREQAAEAYALAVLLRPDLYALIPAGPGGLTREDVQEVLPSAWARVRAGDPNQLSRALWDIGLVEGTLPSDAPHAWAAVAAAVDGDRSRAESLLAEARQTAPYDQLTHLAAAAVARYACDTDAYDRAMRLAGRILGAPVPALAIVRDPIYREPGLGDYQPSSVRRPPVPDIWPFGLVEAPACEP